LVKFLGVATVTTADIIASNGVIHVVDKVIGLPTIVLTPANPNFTSLVGASGAGQPFRNHFVWSRTIYSIRLLTMLLALNTELALRIASVSAANLTKVLQYHVVSGNICGLTEGQIVVTLQTPQTFMVQLKLKI
jgi:hypothetical protein